MVAVLVVIKIFFSYSERFLVLAPWFRHCPSAKHTLFTRQLWDFPPDRAPTQHKPCPLPPTVVRGASTA